MAKDEDVVVKSYNHLEEGSDEAAMLASLDEEMADDISETETFDTANEVNITLKQLGAYGDSIPNRLDRDVFLIELSLLEGATYDWLQNLKVHYTRVGPDGMKKVTEKYYRGLTVPVSPGGVSEFRLESRRVIISLSKCTGYDVEEKTK